MKICGMNVSDNVALLRNVETCLVTVEINAVIVNWLCRRNCHIMHILIYQLIFPYVSFIERITALLCSVECSGMACRGELMEYRTIGLCTSYHTVEQL